jgi:hypothetical protein
MIPVNLNLLEPSGPVIFRFYTLHFTLYILRELYAKILNLPHMLHNLKIPRRMHSIIISRARRSVMWLNGEKTDFSGTISFLVIRELSASEI